MSLLLFVLCQTKLKEYHNHNIVSMNTKNIFKILKLIISSHFLKIHKNHISILIIKNFSYLFFLFLQSTFSHFIKIIIFFISFI